MSRKEAPPNLELYPFKVDVDADWTTGRRELADIKAFLHDTGWQANATVTPHYDENERLWWRIHCNHADVAVLLKLRYGGER